MSGRDQHVISVEELLSNSRKANVVRAEAGETNSRGNDAAQVTENDSTTKQRLEQLDNVVPNEAEKTGPKIQKVPYLLREDKNIVAKYFEPRAVSRGPIHHGESKYQKAEGDKLRWAYKFVKESGKTAESLYAEIKKKIKQLREYFEEEVTKKYDDKDLAWMLFVDGCAVLEFIHCAVEDKFEYVEIKNDQAVFVQQDLFLLENQLPYQLLKDLMELSNKKYILHKSIDLFIENHANCKAPKMTSSTEKPVHLLHCLRTRLLFQEKKSDNESSTKTIEGDLPSYRSISVQELRAAGIQLKPSETNCLADVYFSDQFTFSTGCLFLPQITVDESTGPTFMNLMAYEKCPDFENDYGITSYICFLNSLIDYPDDVKELRKAHILHSLLGNDIKVAQLINDIGAGTYLVPNPETYANVKKRIRKCYENNIYNYILSKLRTWIAEVIHDHFRSPWVILGLLAALLGLVLTAIQTWYTVYSPPGPCDDFCRRRP